MSAWARWRREPPRPPAAPGLEPRLRALAQEVKGFLHEEEGLLLYELAFQRAGHAPCLEVGSYCGKSSVYLGAGCRDAGGHPLLAVDHHRGSEEQQPGQEYCDADLCDGNGRVDTLPHFRRNLAEAGLEGWVLPLVAPSRVLARYWRHELALVFIDGGHGLADVEQDFTGWAGHVAPGGVLCMHDLYADPADGGQAPYEVFERARATRSWTFVTQVGSLGVLRRL